jgi:uroporphyrinogen-III synthase
MKTEMHAPLKVIVTRPSPDAEALAAEILRCGGEPILSPVMAIRPRPEPVDLSGVGALAFTSANGVRIFAALSPARDIDVFAVGEATARAAAAAGFKKIHVADGDVESLAALIANSKQGSKILHLAGSERAGDLIASLARLKIPARRAVIYDAVAVEEISAQAAKLLASPRERAAVVFFSPRSARLFIRQVQRAGGAAGLKRCVAVCLSDTIAAELDPAAWRDVRIAADRSADGAVAVVEALCRAERSHGGAS